LVKNRVEKYCQKNNIELKDYSGPLPYRLYLIPVGGMSKNKAIRIVDKLMKRKSNER